MRNLKAVLFVALAACGGGSETPTPVDTAVDTAPPVDDPPPPDSQVLDLSCAVNQTPPTTANATVTISGQASSVDFNFITASIETEPADEADIDVCINDCVGNNNILDSTTSDMLATCGADSCAFTTAAIDTPNGTEPLDAYLKVSKTGLRTTNIAPSEPLRMDLTSVPAVMLTPTAFAGAAGIAQVNQNDTDNGAMIVAVTDCALNPVVEATLTVTQKGAPVGTIFNGGNLAAEAGGGFIVFNVPAGETTVGASVNGTTLRAHVVQVFAGETTATQVTPGFAAP